jgi:DNA excision repair protein ERCC-4
MREFRSSLPSMLHAADIQVVPCTLQVGDYVLTPTMCVERKSLSDLVQSFSSGRLYTQCELMCVHYQHPILLIEFEQDKSFSLRTVEGRPGARAPTSDMDVQAKLVLLTAAFPRLCLIWSSSPAATADIFRDLKLNFDEPDPAKVALVGIELDDAAPPGPHRGPAPEQAFHLAPQDLLRALPGITTNNFRYVMNHVRDLADLAEMPHDELRHLLGAEPARHLSRFLSTDAHQTPPLLP